MSFGMLDDSRSGIMSTMDMLKFRKKLARKLEQFKFSVVSEKTRFQMDEIIRETFTEMKQRGQRMVPFEGMEVIGADTVDGPTNDAVSLKWKTVAYGRTRFDHPFADHVVLGFYNEYDLYLAKQDLLPPTFIARYGNGPEDYSSYNPSILGVSNISEHGWHFFQAYQRALYIGANLGI